MVMCLSCSPLKAVLIVMVAFALLSAILPLSRSDQPAILDWSSPTLNDLYSVFMINASDGWVVGAGGTVIHWNGVQWSNVASSTLLDLNSVFFFNDSEGWAVGQSGLILEWNGTSWNPMPGPTNADLNSVFMINADDGWAVGNSFANIVQGRQQWNETIIHWTGSNWINVTATPTVGDDLLSVAMVNSTDGWAVGAGGTMIHWNGIEWRVWSEFPNSSTPAAFRSVCMLSTDYGWAVGDLGTAFQWDGTQWTGKAGVACTCDYSSVFFLNPSDGWIVGITGTIWVVNSSGPVAHWNGTKWTWPNNPATSPVALNSVFMVDANEGWIVGGHGIIMRWTGVEWTIPEYPLTLYFVLLPSMTLASIALTKRLLKDKRQRVLC
jgi:photosystem II stability/assembly factor-like uncharacterized protein